MYTTQEWLRRTPTRKPSSPPKGTFCRTLCSIWSSVYGASNTLFGNYLLAHSFLILACTTMLVQLEQNGGLDPENGIPLLAVSLLFLSVAGGVCSILLSRSWERTTAQARLIRWHLDQLEEDHQATPSRDPADAHLFLDLLRLQAGCCLERRHSEAVDPTLSARYLAWFNPSTATRGGGPARWVPLVLLTIYGLFWTIALSKMLDALTVACVAGATLFLVGVAVALWSRQLA